MRAIVSLDEQSNPPTGEPDAGNLPVRFGGRQKHLGSYFPDGADEDVDAKEAALRMTSTSILGGAAKLSTTGKIQEAAGVPHIKHHNFGGKV